MSSYKTLFFLFISLFYQLMCRDIIFLVRSHGSYVICDISEILKGDLKVNIFQEVVQRFQAGAVYWFLTNLSLEIG